MPKLAICFSFITLVIVLANSKAIPAGSVILVITFQTLIYFMEIFLSSAVRNFTVTNFKNYTMSEREK